LSGSPRSTLRHVFGMPILLAAISLVGLLVALLGDGLWDALSWLSLAIPLAVIAHKLRQGRRRPAADRAAAGAAER
jgi:hypothetical protein